MGGEDGTGEGEEKGGVMEGRKEEWEGRMGQEKGKKREG